jgi:hypothetical protein
MNMRSIHGIVKRKHTSVTNNIDLNF